MSGPLALLLLAAASLNNPLTWAVLIGWIGSVVLHEFAHGIVGYWGGDYTIKERGGLTLNPLKYVDPLNTVILPVLFLAMGGIPLPGGATYVRRDLLRSRTWDAAVSAAGPAMNLLLFLALSVAVHPRLGWVDVNAYLGMSPGDWPRWLVFVAAMAQLQMIAVVLNLIPVPPLDGFQMIAAYLPAQTRRKLLGPPIGNVAFLLLFLVLWQVPGAFQAIFRLTVYVWRLLGFEAEQIYFFARSFNQALFGTE